MRPLTSISLPLLLQVACSVASPASRIKRQSAPVNGGVPAGQPAIPADFPDPTIINTNNTWYAFATTNGVYNVQIARSADFQNWQVGVGDILPNLPSWAQGPVWAPDISRRDDGLFLLYYSAALKAYPAHHCVGAAVSRSIEGPFSPMTKPLLCPDPNGQGSNVSPMIPTPGRGGAIDASSFRDVDGKRYLLWKVDGNSVGSGGLCGNGNPGAAPTPIMMIQVAGDGTTPLSSPIQLLDRTDLDGPLIEAPSLMRARDGTYNLFFSSNCYTTPNYDVTFASSRSIWGPYQRQDPLIQTGQFRLVAPGGASVSADWTHLAYHADFGQGRAMYTFRLDAAGTGIRLV